MSRILTIASVFLIYVVCVLHFSSVQCKQFCWKCLMKNGSMCTSAFSTKVRCADIDYVTFLCFQREYNNTDSLSSTGYTFVSERNCIRKDMFDAGWPCKNNQNCYAKACGKAMCNSSWSQISSFFTIIVTFLITTLMLKQ